MAYYKTPAEMFSKRAEQAKKDGDLHWAMAKNGEGNHHYGQAFKRYHHSAVNRAKSAHAKAINATWGNKK